MGSLESGGDLRVFVFLAILVALLAAAIWQPQRIRQRGRYHATACLLAFYLVVECVALIVFPASSMTSLMLAQSSADLMRVSADVSTSFFAMKFVAVCQYLLLATSLLTTVAAFSEPDPNSESIIWRLKNLFITPLETTREEARGTDTCLKCGGDLSPDSDSCRDCGWTWQNHQGPAGDDFDQ